MFPAKLKRTFLSDKKSLDELYEFPFYAKCFPWSFPLPVLMEVTISEIPLNVKIDSNMSPQHLLYLDTWSFNKVGKLREDLRYWIWRICAQLQMGHWANSSSFEQLLRHCLIVQTFQHCWYMVALLLQLYLLMSGLCATKLLSLESRKLSHESCELSLITINDITFSHTSISVKYRCENIVSV